MEKNMSATADQSVVPPVAPRNISTSELLKYAWLYADTLPVEWDKELILRLEEAIDDGR